MIGAVGHDFYTGQRDGAKGFPRFTDPRLRGPEGYADYLRMATERSLERCGIDAFDVLLLHNPDRIGYSSETVWSGMAGLRDAGLTRAIGVAPGPANGFTLDLIGCFERFGALLDWAMIILGPLEPWPGEFVLPAAAAADVQGDHPRRRLRRAVLRRPAARPGASAPATTGAFAPPTGSSAGRRRMDAMRAIADRHGLTMMQLACQWNLAHPAVSCVVPSLIQELGGGARGPWRTSGPSSPRCRPQIVLSPHRRSTRSGAWATTPARWRSRAPARCTAGRSAPTPGALDERLGEVAARWGIAPERDLALQSW